MLLKRLPGTTGNREAEIVRSTAAVVRCLENGGAASMSGDNGAINIWIDDDGGFRCERYSFRVTQSSEVFGSYAKVKAWLAEHRRAIQ